MSLATSSAPTASRLPPRDAVMAQARRENFPVDSYLLSRHQREQLLAIYGFARLVDDLGDEAPGDRLALLDWLEHELDRVYADEAAEHEVMRTLAAAGARTRLPAAPFRRLIDANRVDQSVTRYETFDELLGYCQLSAAPVGELVLHVFDAATPERIELSDRICAALQVTEHLQDVFEDYARGRIYLPRRDMETFGSQESDLAAGPAGDALRRVIAFEAERARALLAAGAPLTRTLSPRPRGAVAGFIAGGRAALDALRRARYDVAAGRPPASTRSFATQWIKAVMGR